MKNGRIERRREEGKIVNMEKSIEGEKIKGVIGIGNKSWEKNGRKVEKNENKNIKKSIEVVKNGIIENLEELREMMEEEGRKFEKEKEKEEVENMVKREMEKGK